MSEIKFVSPSGTFTDPAFSSDYESAARFEKLFVGHKGVYYRDGFRIRCIPYEVMERAFIRVQEVNGRFCCGKAVFCYFRMVFVVGGKEYADVMSENEKLMDEALAAISERSPGTAIGVARPDADNKDDNN